MKKLIEFMKDIWKSNVWSKWVLFSSVLFSYGIIKSSIRYTGGYGQFENYLVYSILFILLIPFYIGFYDSIKNYSKSFIEDLLNEIKNETNNEKDLYYKHKKTKSIIEKKSNLLTDRIYVIILMIIILFFYIFHPNIKWIFHLND